MNDKFTLYRMIYDKVEKLSKYRDIYLCKYTEDNKEIQKILVDDGTDYYEGYSVLEYHTGKMVLAFLLKDNETGEKFFIIHDKKTFEVIIEINEYNIQLEYTSKMVIDELLLQFTIFYRDKISMSHKSIVLIFNNNNGKIRHIITSVSSISVNPNRHRKDLLVEYCIKNYNTVFLTHRAMVTYENVEVNNWFEPSHVISTDRLGANIKLYKR